MEETRGRRLGVKKFGGENVIAGNIIISNEAQSHQ